ncbi:MAG TPA: RusA family crossover junction endodeoxyribonuclease [Stellaceae bacterium]|nr:RusA family crossover junction endodeoxyribonuclease [Stellaceae bacterium]
MSVELRFPFEFVVEGTPVSQQAKRRQSLREWQDCVRAAARQNLPAGHFLTSGPLSITLFYFPATPLQGDIDNIVKPVLDALTRVIYVSDRQLHRVVVQKFEPGNVFEFRTPSAALAEAIGKAKPALYIGLSDNPFEDLA